MLEFNQKITKIIENYTLDCNEYDLRLKEKKNMWQGPYKHIFIPLQNWVVPTTCTLQFKCIVHKQCAFV